MNATRIAFVGFVAFAILAAASPTAAAKPEYLNRPDDLALRLYLTDDGMSPERPTAGPLKLRQVPLDPDKNVTAAGQNVTTFVPWWRGYDSAYATYLLWPGYTATRDGTLTGDGAITLYLTTRSAAAQVTKVFADVCVNCEEKYYGMGGQMYDPAVTVLPGEYKKFVVPINPIDDVKVKVGDKIRFYVNVNVAVTSGLPEIFVAYGSATTPSGIWLRGLFDPRYPGTTERLWFRDFGLLAPIAPINETPREAPCRDCDLTRERTISLGRYVFAQDIRLNGDPMVEYWLRRTSEQIIGPSYDTLLIAASGAERQTVEWVVNGQTLGRTGESMGLKVGYWPGPVGGPVGSFANRWAEGHVVGLALADHEFKKGDILLLQLRITAQEALGKRGLAILFDSIHTPTGVWFGVEKEPLPSPGREGILRPLGPGDRATKVAVNDEPEPDIPGFGRGALGYEGATAMVLSLGAFGYTRFRRR